MAQRPSDRRGARGREIAQWAGFLGLLLAGRASFAEQYVVPSGSMQPTVHVGDRLLVSKIAYGLRVPMSNVYLARFEGPARGDVVVLDAPDQDMVLLKRVVAVPGDRVDVRGGALRINGRDVPVERRADRTLVERLGAQPHAISLDDGGGPDFSGLVPQDRYLLLGDNRGNSRDGRWFGFVPRDRILGRARAVILRDGRPAWQSM